MDDFGELKQSIHIYVYESSGSSGKDAAESAFNQLKNILNSYIENGNSYGKEVLKGLFDVFAPDNDKQSDNQNPQQKEVKIKMTDDKYWEWLIGDSKVATDEATLTKLDACMLIRKFCHRAGISALKAIDLLRVYLNTRAKNNGEDYFETFHFLEDSFVDELIKFYNDEMDCIPTLLQFLIIHYFHEKDPAKESRHQRLVILGSISFMFIRL